MNPESKILAPSQKNYMAGAAFQYLKKSLLRWQALYIVILIFLWEGLPFTLLGMSSTIGYQIYSALIITTSIIYFIRSLISHERFSYWGIIPVLFFTYACACSFIYSVLIKPQPPQAWMIAVYTVSPLFTIFSLRLIRATTGDCINALLIAGFLGSALVIIVNFSGSDMLDFYVRGSAFGTEKRLVFFKLEAAFSAAVSIILLMNYTSIIKYIFYFFIFVTSCYNLFALTESRLAMIAFFSAFSLGWVFLFRAKRKVIALSLAPIALVPLAFYFIDKFLNKFESLEQYLASDVSSRWRVITIKEFSSYFDTTYGLGFGFMSGNPQYNNVISHTSVYGGVPYGLPNYGLYLDDIGIYSSLYQYGYLGLFFVIIMTLLCVFRLSSAYRISPAYEPACACGFMMLSFMISPIAMNYFTLFYTAHIGGLLWFMASRIDAERTLMKINHYRRFGRGA